MEQWFASIIGGGAVGAILTLVYNWLSAKQKADAKEKATIEALIGELRFAILICENNARVQGADSPMLFPIKVLFHACFAERHSYPRLKKLQERLEQYFIWASEINELIDQRSHFQLADIYRTEAVAELHRERVKKYCSGMERVNVLRSTQVYELPEFMNSLLGDLLKAGIQK